MASLTPELLLSSLPAKTLNSNEEFIYVSTDRMGNVMVVDKTSPFPKEKVPNPYNPFNYLPQGAYAAYTKYLDIDNLYNIFERCTGNEVWGDETDEKYMIYKRHGNFSQAVDYIFHGISKIPPQDPSINYPTFQYANGTNQYHLHKDGAKVPDIIVITPYTPNDEDWKHDIDFLTEFQEYSKGVPIGKYEVIYED